MEHVRNWLPQKPKLCIHKELQAGGQDRKMVDTRNLQRKIVLGGRDTKVNPYPLPAREAHFVNSNPEKFPRNMAICLVNINLRERS